MESFVTGFENVVIVCPFQAAARFLCALAAKERLCSPPLGRTAPSFSTPRVIGECRNRNRVRRTSPASRARLGAAAALKPEVL